jgi:hypothetical protein
MELGVVRPKLRLDDAVSSVRARADVDGRLATKLFETGSGATVWSRGASATANVARLGVHAGGGLTSFQMLDPNEAYAGLVPELVAGLADDFYPTWQRQR